MEIDLTEKLIEAIRKRPVLYSNSHPYIRNKLWKLEAWREIEQELNKDVTFLKHKWNYLKSTYKQFKRFHRFGNNSPTPRVKLSHWAWGKYMNFLDEDHVDETQDPLKVSQSSHQQFAANEEDSDNSIISDTPISSPHRDETVKMEFSPEQSSALAENDSDPKVGEKEDNEDDTPISPRRRDETVKIEPSPQPSSAIAENTKKRYSERRRIDSGPRVEKEENDKGRTMQNIQKSTNSFVNSCNSEKVEVNCDAVDLFFLGYANTFKRLSRRKQVLVKFEIAKAFMEAELGDISDR